MKTQVALALGLALSWVPNYSLAGEYRCEEDSTVCLNSMAKHLNKKGWVGIEIETAQEGGPLIVRAVVPDSPAAESGFAVGDQLVSFNKIPYTEQNRKILKEAYSKSRPGDRVSYVVARNGKEAQLFVELGKVPQSLVASWIGQHMLDHHLDPSADAAD